MQDYQLSFYSNRSAILYIIVTACMHVAILLITIIIHFIYNACMYGNNGSIYICTLLDLFTFSAFP